MERFSISVTLGKASNPHGANLAHNNRDFIARNIRRDQMQNNIFFKQQDVRETYSELFGAAIAEYNAKQKQPCRRIKDYYSHIASGKREEPFYEVIVQLGDALALGVELAPQNQLFPYLRQRCHIIYVAL